MTEEYVYLSGDPVAVIAVGSGMTAPTEQILDNSDTATAIAGDWTGVSGVSGYYGSDYRYHVANGAPPGGIIADNTAATTVGTWTSSTGVNGYYAADYQYHAAGTGANSMTWTPAVTTAGNYNVYARWTANPNRATNAPYTITHAGGSTTVTMNQQQNGGQWVSLGTYSFAADGTASIALTDQADGYVIADAVKLTPVGAPPNSVTWQPSVVQSGSYKVYARWSANPNRATNAPYTINHASGSTTVTMNQQQNGGQWNLLGTFILDANSSIMLTDVADGYVIADAIRLVGSAASTASDIYYIHNDHLGTPQAMTDINGTVVWTMSQTPFWHRHCE